MLNARAMKGSHKDVRAMKAFESYIGEDENEKKNYFRY